MFERIFILICVTHLICGVISLKYECTPRNQQETGMGVANCSAQELSHVPPNLAHNIQVLDLSNNDITILNDYSFVKYEKLKILYLRNNSLSSLHSQAFSHLQGLEYLDLSFNNLGMIPSQTFHDISALLTLSLNGNKITNIQRNTFKNLTRLTNLYLAGNHIQYIHPKAFDGLARLQQLELQNNALSTMNGSVLKYLTDNLKHIKLYNNPWYCDCNLRWLLQWLHNSSDSPTQRLKWQFPPNEPTCQGPNLVSTQQFSILSSDLLVCPIRIYSKARNIETSAGSEVHLFCKFMADPPVEIQWLKNGQLIDLTDTWKYVVETEGDVILISQLHIYNFEQRDIGEYECFAENLLGKAYDSSMVTLEGVDPIPFLTPDEPDEDDEKDRVRNAIIATSTIIGVVLLLCIIAAIGYLCIRCKRIRKKKRESIRMTFEEHLKANGIIEPKQKAEPMIYDDVPDETASMDGDAEDSESVYDSLQRPRIPSSANTNTYFSFKTEFSEPEDMTQAYSTGQPSSNYKGSDGSQCESTSPLLENISPILIDPHDPFYEANLYVPNLSSYTANYLNSTPHGDYTDENRYVFDRVAQTLPHNVRHYIPTDDGFIPRRTHTLPHGYSYSHVPDYYCVVPVMRSNSVSVPHHKSASVGHLELSPPKKPPRLFHSRDTMSLHSHGSHSSERERSLKLSLPKPSAEDKYGTAV